MKNKFYNSLFAVFLISVFTLIIFPGCSDKGDPSLYPGTPTAPNPATAPVISSISPAAPALAGVSQITITGKNFSTNPLEDLVYFNGVQVNLESATSTQLTLTAPNITSDSITIMVAVLNSSLFSNRILYSLSAVAKDIYPDANSTFIVPYSLASDNSGNIYSSLTVNGSSSGVIEIANDTSVTNYAPKGPETFWSSMRFGPNGVLFTARNVSGVYQIPAGGGAPKTYVAISPSSIKISQLEFDALGNLWAGGNNSSLYRINQDKSVHSFPFVANITAMRIYNDGGTNYLYVAATQNSDVSIQRFPIDSNDNLGAPQQYYDFTANYGTGASITALEFSADGDMYLGTNLPQAIIVVHPDKSSAPLYSGILKLTGVVSMAWGSGNYLYYIRAQSFDVNGALVVPETIVKLDIQKPGAPYFGR